MNFAKIKNNLTRFTLSLALVFAFAGFGTSSISAEAQVCVTVPGAYGSSQNCTPVERTSITSGDVIAVSIASFTLGIAALGAVKVFKLAEAQILATTI